MKTNLPTIIGISILISATAAFAQGVGGPGEQEGDGQLIRNRIQTELQAYDPTLEQARSRLRETLPAEVLKAVEEMKQAREAYQQRVQELKKAAAATSAQERNELRKLILLEIREAAKSRDREQLRERLQELRDTLPDHAQLMEQTKSQTRDRRGD